MKHGRKLSACLMTHKKVLNLRCVQVLRGSMAATYGMNSNASGKGSAIGTSKKR